MSSINLRQAFTATAVAAALATPAFLASGPVLAEADAKSKTSKPPMAAKAPEAKKKHGTQTAQSAKPAVTRLAQLVRKINEHMRAGEEDGSLTRGEMARLASLKERVEIMDRMSKNDETLSTWERRYLETANEILQRIVTRERLDRQMSPEPKHVELRIQRGIEDGTLSQRQAESLRKVQLGIIRAGREAAEDGVVTRKEKLRIWRAQFKLSHLVNHTRRYGPIKRALGQPDFKAALERGIRNGSFSRREARALWFAHRRIRTLRDRATSDGRITATELALLNRRLQEARRRLSYGERAAYRRSLRTAGHRAMIGRSRSAHGSESAHQGAAAARNYGRSIGGGMRSLNRTFGGR